MSDHVILLHGIWMRGFTLAPFARRLRAAGFDSVEAFDYASIGGRPETAVARLAARVRAHDGNVHVVGHSLGGMLAVEMAANAIEPPGRIVCLGSPLRGSAAARGMQRVPVARWIMG